ncbi:hypothetical protein GCM10007160_00040 [Litchfieldella qijiaojingensis]|uniref:DUF3800 domain-containing protein n=1 Tax=Litchfieldella qijiaojingensis TaxID=980347 RepID=A0ABQ2Y9U1_9GAMM|nr:DUF3800 domain-containing protein [Halomonas qijiaojingensis]GGX76889.1 hypothetical protein GCM10007160_00040 [Halomonas qijiaojingensis]
MRWYADNSELNGVRGSTIPDILMFGGVVVNQNDEASLRQSIENVKAKYGHPRAPVKWNFKDLRSLYKKQGLGTLYEGLLKTSKAWRSEIARESLAFDYRIVVSVIEGHSIVKKTLTGCKPNLVRYAFSNGLMRFALHVQDERPNYAQVILDWPDRGDSKPFDLEYRAAYNEGKTGERHVVYHSGPLNALGFDDCAAYVNMHHSTLLQFADMVLGANREVIECAIGKKPSGFGVDFCKEIRAKYRGYPASIVGRGISLASGRHDFRKEIRDFVDRELSI